jgi:hypothetical protein
MDDPAIWVTPPAGEVAVLLAIGGEDGRWLADILSRTLGGWTPPAVLLVRDAARLHRDWQTQQRARIRLDSGSSSASLVEGRLRAVGRQGIIVAIAAAEDPPLDWLGSVCGNRLIALRLALDPPSEATLAATLDAYRHALAQSLGTAAF